MERDKFLSLIPTEVVKKKEINEKIEQLKELIETENSFVSQFSINRYFYKDLIDLEFEQRLNLFEHMADKHCFIHENENSWDKIAIDTYRHILEEHFGLKNMYQLDSLYIESILNGRDITDELVRWDEKAMTLDDLLKYFVFVGEGMDNGDAPHLVTMLVIQRALLSASLAEKNIENLLAGENEIFDCWFLN